MASKIFVQLLVAGAQVVGRAFVQAYKQAIVNQAKTAASGPAQEAAQSTVNAFTRKTGLSLEEAMQILNVEKDSPLQEIKKKYDHLFKVNDEKIGGSFYLQSKIVRAKERIEMERGEKISAVEESEKKQESKNE